MRNNRNSIRNPKLPYSQRDKPSGLEFKPTNKKNADETQTPKTHKPRRKSKKTNKRKPTDAFPKMETSRSNKWPQISPLATNESNRQKYLSKKKISSRTKSDVDLSSPIYKEDKSNRKKEEDPRNQLKQNLKDYNNNPTHQAYKRLMKNVV